jgi:hypothetical protein
LKSGEKISIPARFKGGIFDFPPNLRLPLLRVFPIVGIGLALNHREC